MIIHPRAVLLLCLVSSAPVLAQPTFAGPPANTSAPNSQVARAPEEAGPSLARAGWQEIARCEDGHQWSYVLEKRRSRLLCKGINARGGPSEMPCTPFSGELSRFKQMAKEAQMISGKQGAGAKNCWSGHD